jgi:hypothetical protein
MHVMVTMSGLTLRAAPDGAVLGELVHGDRLEVLGIAQPRSERWWYVRVLAARAEDNVAQAGYVAARGTDGVDSVRIDPPLQPSGRLTAALRLGAPLPLAAWTVGSLAAAAILMAWAATR